MPMEAAAATGDHPVDGGARQAIVDIGVVLERERPRLLALAYAVLRDRAAAMDAVQDTMERAVRSWDALRSPESAGSWLSTICVRRAVRTQQRRAVAARFWQRPEDVGT